MKRTIQAFVLVSCLLTVIHLSCRKSDQKKDIDVSRKDQAIVMDIFFNTSRSTDPVVRKVAEEIERREKRNSFIYDFAIHYGYPVWNKSIISLPKDIKASKTAGIGEGNDSLVYIPVVLQDSVKTNGFIRAVINDSISISYCLAKDYKNYPFSQQAGATTANEFASLLMIMDKNIYGTQLFTITDPRLLNEAGVSNNFTASRGAKILNISSGISTNNLCEGTSYTVSWLVQDPNPDHCTCINGAGSGGVCQDWHTGCAACSNTITITINLGSGSCGGGGSQGPVGGGIPVSGGPSGGSGSGGGQIPPYYPCSGSVQTSLLPEPLPPCPPPGGGVGWTQPATLLSVDASAIVDPCLQSLIQYIGQAGHYSFILKTYFDQQFNNSGPQKKYKVKYFTNTTLTGNSGLPIPGSTTVNFLPDGTNEVVVTLNPSFFQTTTKEWVTSIILHELFHGILTVEKPELNTQALQHAWMFDRLVPKGIGQALEELYPGINIHNAMALGMGGMSEGYLIPGTNIIDPAKNAYALEKYGQNINQAIYTASNYQNAIAGYGSAFC